MPIDRPMITSLLFFPDKEIIERPGDYGLTAEDVFPMSADGVKLHGWYFQARENKGALLFLHGNAGNISGRVHKVTGWVKRGISVLLIDYRGYGQSGGAIQQGDDIVRDAQAGLDWLINRGSRGPVPVILYGESLGSHPAVRLAVKHKTAGLVLEAPFTAFTDLAAIHYPALPKFMTESLLKDFRFDNLGQIAKIQAPLFVIHGTDDATCPYAMGQRLFGEAPQPKEFFSVPHAGHNNLPECAGEDFWKKPCGFLKKENRLS